MEPQIYIAPGPFELETGHTLPELRIAYHTYGTMNAAMASFVALMPVFMGSDLAMAEPA